jgi:hypothetical protein
MRSCELLVASCELESTCNTQLATLNFPPIRVYRSFIRGKNSSLLRILNLILADLANSAV